MPVPVADPRIAAARPYAHFLSISLATTPGGGCGWLSPEPDTFRSAAGPAIAPRASRQGVGLRALAPASDALSRRRSRVRVPSLPLPRAAASQRLCVSRASGFSPFVGEPGHPDTERRKPASRARVRKTAMELALQDRARGERERSLHAAGLRAPNRASLTSIRAASRPSAGLHAGEVQAAQVQRLRLAREASHDAASPRDPTTKGPDERRGFNHPQPSRQQELQDAVQ